MFTTAMIKLVVPAQFPSANLAGGLSDRPGCTKIGS